MSLELRRTDIARAPAVGQVWHSRGRRSSTLRTLKLPESEYFETCDAHLASTTVKQAVM